MTTEKTRSPRETGDRGGFLDNVRCRVDLGARRNDNPIRPVRPLDAVPPVAYAYDGTDGVGRFVDAVTAVGGTARRLAGARDVPALIEEVCRVEGVRTAVVSGDPECRGARCVLEELGVTVLHFDGPGTVATADLGVTGAVNGVALTGSLVVSSARAGGRTASVLPPVHLALVPADRIVPTAGDVLRRFGAFAGGLPSNIAFITGPSRSADIELQLTLGVHGPRAVWIGVIE